MRKHIKKVFRIFFFLITLPVCVLFWVFSSVGSKDSTFSGFSQALSLLPGKIGSYVRSAFYSTVCKNVHSEIVVGFLTVFSHYDIDIEEGVYIGPQCNIGKCSIGKNTLIGSGVHILSGNKQHGSIDNSEEFKKQKSVFTKIKIGSNNWIGNLAIVQSSIYGSGIIVGSASLVVKDIVDENSVYLGSPASRRNQR